MIHAVHSGLPSLGAAAFATGFILCQISCSTRLITVVFWRMSRLTVRKPNISDFPAHGAHQGCGKRSPLSCRRAPARQRQVRAMSSAGSREGLCPRHFRMSRRASRRALKSWRKGSCGLRCADAFALPAGVQLLRQRARVKFAGKAHFIVAERNELDQFRQALVEPLDRGLAVFRQGIARGGDGHKGIAVAVAADPRGKFQAAGAHGSAVPDSAAASAASRRSQSEAVRSNRASRKKCRPQEIS